MMAALHTTFVYFSHSGQMYGDNNASFLRNIITIISKNTLHRTDSNKIVVLETFKHVDISTKTDFSYVILSVATASAICGMYLKTYARSRAFLALYSLPWIITRI